MDKKPTAEEYFLSKYGNKITASESWVIRFAEEYASLSPSNEQEKKKPLSEITEEHLFELARQYEKEAFNVCLVEDRLHFEFYYGESIESREICLGDNLSLRDAQYLQFKGYDVPVYF